MARLNRRKAIATLPRSYARPEGVFFHWRGSWRPKRSDFEDMSVTTETRRAPSFKRLSTPNHKTFNLTAEQAAPATKKWFVVDADNQIVGRLAVKIATILMGKHRADYTPHVDSGDYVVVVNVERVRFSGKSMSHPTVPYYTKKTSQKTYQYFTGFPSGRRVNTAVERLTNKPEDILKLAVQRMLPKTKLGRHMLAKLKLFKGPAHEHQAQQPVEIPGYL
jgi:large subunit ribosomal protein L13